MRLTVVTNNIKGGGAPLAAVTWANAWSERGHDVSLFALFPNDGLGSGWKVDEAIDFRVVDLTERPVANKFGAAARLAKNIFSLRRAITGSRPDMIVSIEGPVNLRILMACLGLGVPVAAMEQTHPGQYSVGRFWERCRRFLYPRARVLVNLTTAARDWCAKEYGPRNSAAIPNPIVPAGVHARTPLDRGGLVVAAGRLVPQKRFDLLIDAFALVADRYPDWNLVINGEGPDRSDLERQVEEKGLAKRISLPGWTDDMASELAKGDFFVLSSEYEGFGNVICEAMAVGLPVVSFDCPSGPGDIVRHEVDGLLVEPLNVERLAQGMSRMMDDRELRLGMGERALEVLERFSLDRTLGLWDEVFALCRR